VTGCGSDAQIKRRAARKLVAVPTALYLHIQTSSKPGGAAPWTRSLSWSTAPRGQFGSKARTKSQPVDVRGQAQKLSITGAAITGCHHWCQGPSSADCKLPAHTISSSSDLGRPNLSGLMLGKRGDDNDSRSITSSMDDSPVTSLVVQRRLGACEKVNPPR
jgi:hypothetical protein